MKFVISDHKYTENDGEVRSWSKFSSPKIYARITVGDVKKTMSVDQSTNYEQSSSFESPASALIKIQVYEEHSIRRDRFLGMIEKTVESICAAGEEVTYKLCKHDANGDLQERQRSISFTIRVTVPAPVHSHGAENHIGDLTDAKSDDSASDASGVTAVAAAKPTITQVASSIADAKQAHKNIEPTTWQPLLLKVERFKKLVAPIAEVHPYSKVVWGVLSALPAFMIDQMNRDDSVKELIALLDHVFDFLEQGPQLESITKLTDKVEGLTVGRFDAQIEILSLLSQQTVECAHFICAYVTDSSYWKRTIKHSTSEVDQKITEFRANFDKLMSEFQDHAVFLTQVTVFQIKFASMSALDKLDNMAMDISIDKMPHAIGARYNPDKGCLPNTRQGIIDEIVDWANKPVSKKAASQIFWLTGLAGSGKSAIAHTVAQRFQAMNRLGSSFCFDVASQAVRGPQHLFSTISWDLGNFDLMWKHALWKVIKDAPSLQTSLSVTEQFESFLLKPSKMLKMAGPIVIVIDALDECGDPSVRKPLLSILGEKIMNLPPNFHILITSRPEPDILEALQNQEHVFCKHMETIDESSTKHDISQFIQSELSRKKVTLNEEWPDESWCKLLVDRSEGLFQWAFTACLFIKEDFYTPVERLRTLVEPSGQAKNLDMLYLRILEQKISANDQGKIDRFVSIMRTVLALKKPLPMSAMDKICSGKTASTIKSVLQPLGALLSGVTSDSTPIQTLHTSFRDFLTDEARSAAFYVETTLEHQNIVAASLNIMKGLKFNICCLPTSYERNKQIGDLETRIQRHIPTHLSYACSFWADHLEKTIFHEVIHTELRVFLNTKLIYWLEVLSLTKSVKVAVASLEKAIIWLKNQDADTVALAIDSQQFIATFWPVITESTPHIYLSALPFMPEKSNLAKTYLGMFGNILSVSTGKAQNWPGVQNVLEGHTEGINAVAFSPTGNLIASGSCDFTVRVWDKSTGHAILEPMKEHTNCVMTVAFSPNGKQIASGSEDKTIRIWDVETGDLAAGPFECPGGIWTVKFSPDMEYIVVGSHKDILLWDIKTSKIVHTLEGHTDWVCSIDFSPDGKHIVSGSRDKGIRTWNVQTGQLVLGPLSGHTDYITSVAVSPDGKTFASGSLDWSILVWDFETGKPIGAPLKAHTGGIISLVFSPDGKKIIAGSDDKKVSIWNIEMGQLVTGLLEGHAGYVYSVASSPDGKSIASGSVDKSIRIWDAEIDNTIVGEFEGHTDSVSAVAFMPNGKHIISGSGDNSIRIWDAETGIPVSKPWEGHTDWIKSLAVASDGKLVVSSSADYMIRVWDVETASTVVGPWKGHTNWINAVALSADGTRIASGAGDWAVQIWDAKTGTPVIEPIKSHTSDITSVLFSPDGKKVISASIDKTIRMWDAETGSPIDLPFAEHPKMIIAVAISSDGYKIASGCDDSKIRIFNAETGIIISDPWMGHKQRVTSVKFSPDGKHLASGSADKTVIVWDVETGEIAAGPFHGHTDWIYCVAFSPDGKRIVSGSDDKTIRVWDIEGIEKPSEAHGKSLLTQFELLTKEVSLSVDGWVLGPKEELLFWLPHRNRNLVYSPHNSLLITKNPTILGYSRFVYGTAWEGCKTSSG